MELKLIIAAYIAIGLAFSVIRFFYNVRSVSWGAKYELSEFYGYYILLVALWPFGLDYMLSDMFEDEKEQP